MPWFINWDDYKANFEAEATRILGQPVHVNGTADASILPSPSLTFTDVTVGETEGAPMMEVRRFSVTIELMPLIQGEINVIAMTLEDPVVRVAVDDAGRIDWTLRGEASRDLDPDKVSLAGVEIRNGTLIYTDAGADAAVTLSEITATVEARSLAGPWRIEGSYSANGTPSQFQVSTGVRAADGSLRVKTDITPGQWPVAIGADGVVAQGETGPSYVGTYGLTQVIPADPEADPEAGDITGWRSEGSFTLTRDRLLVDKAVLSEGPPDRPSSLAGSMTLTLGRDASFDASILARQLDLDRSLGAGPKKPIDMSTAADEFVRWLRGIPVPAIAGTVRFNVPAIVVGGAVIQDVSFTASPLDHGWRVEGLNARLPGQARFTADGLLSTGEAVGFGGAVQLVVNQPATFAAWWRGKSEGGAGRLLSPFDLSGKATVTLDSLKVEEMTTRIGDARIVGRFSWTNNRGSGARILSADLEADRLDFTQVRALAELLGGQNLGDVSLLADSYSIRLAANQLEVADVTMRNVWFDAGFADGNLDVTKITVEDIGGAQFAVNRSRIDHVLGTPLGTLSAELKAPDPATLTRVVEQLAPGTPFAGWFRRAAPYLGASSLNLTLKSEVEDGAPNTDVKLSAKAGATDFSMNVHLAGTPAAWRKADVDVKADLTSYTAAGIVGQLLLRDAGDLVTGDARLDFKAVGVPESGLAASLEGHLGSLALDFDGSVVMPPDAAPHYDGAFRIDTPDVAPILALFDLSLPGIGSGVPVSVSGKAATEGLAADLQWQNGLVAGRQVSGGLRLAPGAKGGLHVGGGNLDVDLVDLGWIAALGLGASPLPTGDPDEPWSREPFGEVALAGLIADLDIAAERLTAGEATEVRNGALHLAVTPARVDLDIKSGNALGGTVAGGFSVRNVGGNASLTGNLSLVGGALDSIIWQRAGRPVGNGTLDLSTNFEATGRSPAGMIASLTGGGTLAVHDGEARYLNPKAGVLVIRDSDVGQEFTEDALRDLLGSYIDNGSLSFTQVEAPFAIAAGTVRFQNIVLDAAETRATGSAAIDLNTMSLDSDWTLVLDPGDDRLGGDLPPQVGLVFRGPLAAPERILDVLQFNSYLAIRQEARLQEILAMEEQARLENAFFNRVKRKIREDAERAARIAEEARLARLAYLTNLQSLHAAREAAAERKAEDELIAWWTVAEKAAADKAAAEAEADRAAADARDARADADAAAARVAELAAASRDADAAVTAAEAASSGALEALATAGAALVNASAARDDAAVRLDAATTAVAEAETTLKTAEADRSASATNAQALLVKSEAAADVAASAADRSRAAQAVVEDGKRRADERAAMLADLESDLAAADAALDAANAEATAKTQVSDALARAAEDAAAKAAAGAPDAAATGATADLAEAERAKARDALGLAETAKASAVAGLRVAEDALADARTKLEADTDAAMEAERAAAVARARAAAADAAGDADAAALRDAAEAASDDATAKSGARDRSRELLETAEADLQEKSNVLTTAEAALTDAEARLVDAGTAAEAARDAADRAATILRAAEMERTVAEKAVGDARAAADAAASVVADRAATRDALAARVEEARKAAEDAAAELRTAAEAASAAAGNAADAHAAAELAAHERDAADTAFAGVTNARDSAAAALDEARARAEAAGAALAEADAHLAEATAVRDAAAIADDDAQQRLEAARVAAENARSALADAEEEAATALARADAAAAAARNAAARAAAMPAGWRTPDQRADVAPARNAVAAPAPDPPQAEDSATRVDFVPVTPRLRPSRPPVTAADEDLDLDLGLPGVGRQLTISQPQ